MKKTHVRRTLTHQFVEFIPEQLQEGLLYVSTVYATAAHRCFCGCGREVVTPLSPTDWKLSFDGEVVSLSPSIGNWSFPCRSHYWITDNSIQWCAEMSEEIVNAGRARDRIAKSTYYRARQSIENSGKRLSSYGPGQTTLDKASAQRVPSREGQSLFSRLLSWLKTGQKSRAAD